MHVISRTTQTPDAAAPYFRHFVSPLPAHAAIMLSFTCTPCAYFWTQLPREATQS